MARLLLALNFLSGILLTIGVFLGGPPRWRFVEISFVALVALVILATVQAVVFMLLLLQGKIGRKRLIVAFLSGMAVMSVVSLNIPKEWKTLTVHPAIAAVIIVIPAYVMLAEMTSTMEVSHEGK